MHIIFSGGGTLGPVTPLLAIASAIRALRPSVACSWIGTKGGPEAELVRDSGIEFHAISSGKLRRYASFRNLTDPFRVLAGYVEARRLLKALKPDAVVSAGGFVAVPVVWAAGHLGIPVHVHQQDIRPGLANRLSLRYATSLSVAFEKSVGDFRGKDPVWTGNPVRSLVFSGSKDEAVRTFGIDPGVPTVLVLGGGTGSATLNELVRAAAPRIAEAANVIHVTGAGKSGSGEGMPARYRQAEFLLSDIRHAYAAADVVVTRAGMGVLTELAALGKAAVIVPIPASHQEDNAAFFAQKGAALVLDERTTFSKGFADAMLSLLGDADRRRSLAAGIAKLTKPDAAATVGKMVMESAEKRPGRGA